MSQQQQLFEETVKSVSILLGWKLQDPGVRERIEQAVRLEQGNVRRVIEYLTTRPLNKNG